MAALDRVSVEKLNPDGLSGVRWSFFLLGDKLVVDVYEEFSRASKRHQPKVLRSWRRLNSRDSFIKRADVPLPPAIAKMAKDAFLQALVAGISVGFQD